MRLFLLKADLLAAEGNKAGTLATLREAAAYGASLPAALRPTRDLTEIDKRLTSLQTQ
jgi:hypothetical protein